MSRGRRGGRNRTTVAKAAADVADSATILGTIADANSVKLPDVDVYYMLYRKQPWVRAVVDITANAIAQEGFAVKPLRGKDVEDGNEDPRIDEIVEFMDVAFPDTSQRSAFVTLGIDMLVYGWGYWRRKFAGKLLVGLERIDPRLMKPKFNTDRTAIVSWLRKSDASATNVTVKADLAAEEIPAEEVVFFKFPGGDQLLGPGSKLESLDLTLAIDLSIRKQRNAAFRNGAPVGTILSNKSAQEDQVRAAVKQIRNRRGSERAYEPLVLTGDWTVNQTMQTGKNDVDFVKGTALTREEVCAAYTFPLGKLMFSSGALGSSGKGEDDATFQEECVLPLEEIIYETISREVLHKDFKGSYDDLQLVPKRRDALRLDRIEAAEGLIKVGGSGNDARDLVGLPRLKDRPDMDEPRFAGHTGQTAADDLDTAPTPADPNPNADDAGDAAVAARNEVGQTAAKGKRWIGY